jgi:salicylate hydroxylase
MAAIGELRKPNGAVLKRAEFPPEEALGGRMVVALRPAVHGALLEAVGAESIVLEREATGFAAAGDRVELQFANGERVEGDVLIGADGAYSAIRRALHPDEPPPRSSGIIAVRGAVHGAQRHLGDLAGVIYLGRGIESTFARASATGIYWYLSLAQSLVPEGLRDAAALVAHMATQFDATFRAITSATEERRLDELVDRDPIPFWGLGRVTLLGDAAHPLLPHTGQGAAQAIVDAVTLGRLLAGDAAIEPALRSYEQQRRARTTTLLRQGRRTAALMSLTNPIGCAIRDGLVRIAPMTSLVKILVTINRRAGTDVRRG